MNIAIRSWWLTAALWTTAGVGAVAAVRGWREATSPQGVRLTPQRPSASVPRLSSPDTLRMAASMIVERDPFRVDRRPSTVAFRTDLEGAAPPPPPPKPPRPALSLAGIIGGPPWEALLVGIPGKDGSFLVRQGDVIDGFRIRSVGHDSVVVQASDTTWRLAVKSPWQ
jgi:hypothetical protein